MTRHADAYDLDELAAGLAGQAIRAHVRDCAECAGRAARVEAQHTAALAAPAFHRGLAGLPVTSRRPRLRWIAALAAAAAGLLLVARGPVELRAKGSASFKLVGAAKIGEQVELRLSPGRYHYALVASIEGSAPKLLRPPGPIAGPERLVLRVTPGASRLVAVFADAPLAAAAVDHPPAGAERIERQVVPAP